MKPAPLVIVSLVFAASFSARAATMAQAALAGEPPAASPQPTSALAAPAASASTHAAQPDPGDGGLSPKSAIDPDVGAFLSALRERSDALKSQEEALAARASTLEAVERRVDEKIALLKATKDALESRLAIAEEAAEKDIAHLARMYEAMKPQKAGEIFNAMEPSFAAGFLTAMSSESAALILANMETQKAYSASVIIAGRNAAFRNEKTDPSL